MGSSNADKIEIMKIGFVRQFEKKYPLGSSFFPLKHLKITFKKPLKARKMAV